jgi:hypothetical protein
MMFHTSKIYDYSAEDLAIIESIFYVENDIRSLKSEILHFSPGNPKFQLFYKPYCLEYEDLDKVYQDYILKQKSEGLDVSGDLSDLTDIEVHVLFYFLCCETARREKIKYITNKLELSMIRRTSSLETMKKLISIKEQINSTK